MSMYNRVFNVPEENIVRKGILDMYVPGTANRGIGAAIVNKSGVGMSAYALVFERISGSIDLGAVDMDFTPLNKSQASLRIHKSGTGNVCEIIGSSNLLKKYMVCTNRSATNRVCYC